MTLIVSNIITWKAQVLMTLPVFLLIIFQCPNKNKNNFPVLWA